MTTKTNENKNASKPIVLADKRGNLTILYNNRLVDYTKNEHTSGSYKQIANEDGEETIILNKFQHMRNMKDNGFHIVSQYEKADFQAMLNRASNAEAELAFAKGKIKALVEALSGKEVE